MSAMEINKKAHSQQTQQVSQAQYAGATSSTSAQQVSKKPIDMTFNGKTVEIPADFVSFVNSEEFASAKHPLRLLKKKFPFLEKASKAEIQAYINAAQQTAETENTQSSKNTQVDGNQNVKAETAETAEEAETDTEAKTANSKKTSDFEETEPKKSEIEALADEYAEETGFPGDIDELRIYLLDVEKQNNLTDKEKALLDAIRTVDKPAPPTKTDKSEKEAAVEDAKLYLSPQFQQLSNEDKLKFVVDRYLGSTNEDYQNMSDEDKQAYLETQTAALVAIATKGKSADDLKGIEQKRLVADVLALTQVAKKESISLEELEAMPEEELNSKVVNQENQVVKEIFSLVSKDTIDKTSYSDMVQTYADTILTLLDDNYASMTNESEKQKIRDEKIDDFITKSLGIANWNEVKQNSKARDAILTRVAVSLKNCVENANEDQNILDAFTNYEKQPEWVKHEDMIGALESRESSLSETDKVVYFQLKAEQKIYSYIKEKYDIDNPTDEQIAKYYQEIQSQLTPEEKAYLDKYVQYHQKMSDMEIAQTGECKNQDHETSITQKMSVEGFTGTREEYIESRLKGINKDNFADKKENIIALLRSTESQEDVDQILGLLEKQGFSPQEIAGIITESGTLQIRYCQEDTPEGFIRTTDFAKKLGTSEATETATTAVKLAPKWYENQDDVIKIGNDVIEDPNFQDAYTQGLHEYRPREEVGNIFQAIVAEGNHSDATIATFSTSLIKYAKSDSDRLYHVQRASSIDNSAVLEGLASASKYVVNSNAKATYTKTITQAAKSYPAEVQKLVSNAIKSGKISEQTLAKTSVSTSSTVKAQTSSASTKDTQGTATTSSKATTQNVGTSTKLTDSSSKQTSSTYQTSSIKPQTSSVSPTYSSGNTISEEKSSNVNASATQSSTTANSTTEAMTAQKETAMQNVEQTREKILTSISEWEDTHKRTLSDEDKEIVEEIAEVITDDSSNSDDTKSIIISSISKAGSIGEIYDILVSALGSKVHDKFIEALASSSSEKIRSFVSAKSYDADIVKELYEHCSSKNIKKDLISLMGGSTVKDLLSAGKISDYADVQHGILYDFFRKDSSLYTMSDADFNNLKNYLTSDEFEALKNLRNGDEDSIATSNTKGKTSVSQGTKASKTAKNNKTSKLFAANEMTKTLGDGTVITRVGTSTGAISADWDNDSYKVVNDGSPIGMNDDTLTVGSDEWRAKYNQQLSSNKVASNRFPAGKTRQKLNPNLFNYNA